MFNLVFTWTPFQRLVLSETSYEYASGSEHSHCLNCNRGVTKMTHWQGTGPFLPCGDADPTKLESGMLYPLWQHRQSVNDPVHNAVLQLDIQTTYFAVPCTVFSREWVGENLSVLLHVC